MKWEWNIEVKIPISWQFHCQKWKVNSQQGINRLKTGQHEQVINSSHFYGCLGKGLKREARTNAGRTFSLTVCPYCWQVYNGYKICDSKTNSAQHCSTFSIIMV